MSTLRKTGTDATDELVESGQRLYDERLRAILEPEHEGEFVAIEPESERCFLGPTGPGGPARRAKGTSQKALLSSKSRAYCYL